MPLVGYRCPRTAPTYGETHPFDHCVNACPHHCLPPAVLFAISEENKTNPHKGFMISPSGLKGCARKLVWSRLKDYYQEPIKLYAALRGSIIHGFLEKPWNDDVLLERRLFYEMTTGPMAPYPISGQIDGYYIRSRRRLEDYKTVSEKATYTLYNQGAKEEHVWQTNVYKFLLKHGRLDSMDGEVLGYDVDEIVISYIFMNRIISTGKQFVELFYEFKEPNYGRPYKCEIDRKQIGKTKRGCPIWQVTFNVPAVPLIPDDDIIRFIEEKAPDQVRGFKQPGFVPSGVIGTPDEWQCDWCGVRELCKAYEDEQKERAVMEPLPFE